MKYWIAFIWIFAFLLSCQTITKKVQEGTKAEINGIAKFDIQEEFHNFGNLQAGEIVSYTFVFSNKGNAPLEISELETDCNCIEAKVLEKVIGPGHIGHLVVTYNSSRDIGKQLKEITIVTNTRQKKIHLYVRANVQNEMIELYS